MKKWVIVDDCTKRRSAVFDEICKAQTKEGAYAEAKAKWNALTEHDKRDSDAYFVGHTDFDEDGCIDYDSMTDILTIKEYPACFWHQ